MKRTLLGAAALALFAAPAWAGLAFQLQPSVGSGRPGTIPVIFAGTLVDTDTDQSFLFLNDISIVFTPPAADLSADPTGQTPTSPNTFFFNNVPGTLIGDGDPIDTTYTGPIFEIYIAPGTPLGDYTGVISILGGYNGPGVDLDTLASVNFHVLVVQEPATMALWLIGLGGILLARQRCSVRT